MKKFLSEKFLYLFLLMTIALMANSQHVTPRTCTDGYLCNYPIQKYTTIRDTAGADTLYLNPTNFSNLIYINNGDTVSDNFKITVNDTVAHGAVYNIRRLSYFGDQMDVMFKNGATLTDTVRFYGYIQAPSTFIANTANAFNTLHFFFNGSKWVLQWSDKQN